MAEMFALMNPDSQKRLLEKLEEENPELAEAIRKQVFVFENLLDFDDEGIRLIIQRVEESDLVLALRKCSDDLKEKILSQLPKRKRSQIEETLSEQSPQPLGVVSEAQRKISEIAKKLFDKGKIFRKSESTD